ncbi:hypothetical protein Dimus_020658, partial [Dionaea muscipula]
RWENLFKKRMLVHVDAVKEFYAKMTVIHLKKKDVVKSSVKGIGIEFDHERCATILGVHWKEWNTVNTSKRCGRSQKCDPKIWEERHLKLHGSTYMDHLMARRIMKRHYGDWLTMVFEAFGVPLVDKKGEEPKKYDFFEDTFLTMCKLTRENEIWWIGSGENRRRDDVDAQEVEEEEEDEGNKDDFDWEAVIDEATVEGESARERDFMMLEDETRGSQEVQKRFSDCSRSSARRRIGLLRSRPSRPTSENSKAEFTKFERV